VIQASVKEWSKSYEVIDDVLTEQARAVERQRVLDRLRRRFRSGTSPRRAGSRV